MNEYQHDHNFDSNHNHFDPDPNLSPEVPDLSQQSFTHPTHTEQPWEQSNITDFSQPDLSGTHDSPGYSDMGMSDPSHSHLLDSNATDYHNQHLSSGYEQPDYSAVQNYHDGGLDSSNHNSHLLEPNHGGDLNYLQRSGGDMVTINNLSKEHEVGDIITDKYDKTYKITDYSPIHGGYDAVPVERHPGNTYKEQGSSNTFIPLKDVNH